MYPLHPDQGAFGGLPEQEIPAKARFAVLPVPFDGTSTWLKGADRGPEALLDASANLELYDIETGLEPYQAGIHTFAPMVCESVEEMVAATREACADLLARGYTVAGLGGEHSVSIGLIQAHADRFPGMGVLQVDAHGDTREEYEGTPFNHACVMARARELCPIVQVGIRSLAEEEVAGLDPARVFFAHQIHDRQDWIAAAVELLPEQVYLTIDLDGLDPSIMPSTGTPEPGGLGWYQLQALIRELCRRRRLVGFDVVELLPNPGNPAPDFLAAKLVYRIMAEMLAAETSRF